MPQFGSAIQTHSTLSMVKSERWKGKRENGNTMKTVVKSNRCDRLRICYFLTLCWTMIAGSLFIWITTGNAELHRECFIFPFVSSFTLVTSIPWFPFVQNSSNDKSWKSSVSTAAQRIEERYGGYWSQFWCLVLFPPRWAPGKWRDRSQCLP
jgi:hypothetical protein